MSEQMRGFAKLGALLGVIALLGCGSTAPPSGDGHPPKNSRPTGTLYLADTKPGRLTVVHVAQARTETRALRELSPGDPPYMVAVVGRRLVVYGHDHTYAFDLSLRGPARSLGESWFFVPSATAGLVWLVRLDDRDPHRAHGFGSVRQVTENGSVALAPRARPPRSPIVAAVAAGLLVQAGTLEVWDPTTGKIRQKLPGLFPVATRDSRVVSCAPRCRVLHLTDTSTGADILIAPGSGFRFVESYDGAFSPDGTLVAVPAVERHGQSRVALVDLARRVATLVPGPPLAHDYQLLTWSSSGWLFYNAGAGRIAAYRPGRAGATLLPLHVEPFVDIAAR